MISRELLAWTVTSQLDVYCYRVFYCSELSMDETHNKPMPKFLLRDLCVYLKAKVVPSSDVLHQSRIFVPSESRNILCSAFFKLNIQSLVPYDSSTAFMIHHRSLRDNIVGSRYG